jgi:hypothetical protein
LIAQADFSGISRANAEPILFTDGQPTLTISINITDDNLAEGGEHFSVHIISGGNVSNFVVLTPIATINIVDNDGKCYVNVTRSGYMHLLPSPLHR